MMEILYQETAVQQHANMSHQEAHVMMDYTAMSEKHATAWEPAQAAH